MHLSSDSYDFFPTNIVLSAISGFTALITNLDPAITVVLPVVLFVFGKVVDVAVKLYLEKRK